MLLVEAILIKSGELVPATVTKFVKSPALRPTVANPGPVNPLFNYNNGITFASHSILILIRNVYHLCYLQLPILFLHLRTKRE